MGVRVRSDVQQRAVSSAVVEVGNRRRGRRRHVDSNDIRIAISEDEMVPSVCPSELIGRLISASEHKRRR